MANRYWVGGTATWDATAGTKWATTSGGAGGSAVPSTADDVFFDASSGSVTVSTSGGPSCKTLTTTGFVGTLSGQVNTFGNTGTVITLASGQTVSGLILNHVGSGGSISSNGATIATLVIGAIGGNQACSLSLNDNLTLSSGITIGTGVNAFTQTLITNNFNITTPSILATTSPFTFNMGSSTVTVTGNGTMWDLLSTDTVNAGTSLIKFTNNSTTNKVMNGGGKIYNNIWINTSGTGVFQINDSNTFNDIKCDGGRTISFQAAKTQTVSSLTFSCSAGNLVTLNSITASSAWSISSANAIAVDYVSLRDSTATGTGSFTARIHSTNVSGNTGWVFNISYTLAVTVGAFTLSGITTLLRKGKTLTASVAAFTLTGVSVNLRHAYRLSTSVGTFTLTGIAVSFRWAHQLVAAVSNFLISGIDILLRFHTQKLFTISRPATTFINTDKVSTGETWATIDTTWASEIRTWAELSQLISNHSKQSSSITNNSKPS